jgi:hypothetical protein
VDGEMSNINPILEARGLGGAHLLLFEDHIRVINSNVRNSVKNIPLSQIESMHLKKVGIIYQYLQFSFVNTREIKGILVHFRDEATIKFRPKRRPAFEAIKTAIENHKAPAILTGNIE